MEITILAILLVISVVVNIILGVGFWNSKGLNEDYEETILTLKDDLETTYEELKVVDLNGAFESDDEVGFVFKYILDAIESLNKKYNPEYDEPERDKQEKQKGLERFG